MSDKIIQIIPVQNWWAVYIEDDRTETYSAIPCIGLKEDGSVEFLDTDLHGFIDEVDSASNFLRVEYSNENKLKN